MQLHCQHEKGLCNWRKCEHILSRVSHFPLVLSPLCSFEYITHCTGSAGVLNLMVSGFLEGKIKKFGLGMRGHWL